MHPASKNKFRGAAIGCAGTILMWVAGGPVLAQENNADADATIEEVVVTGTRRTDRTVATSSIPIDVISGETLSQHSFSDMTDVLRTQVVSLNVQRFVTNDGAVFTRPFTLRGLPPDQTLVLVNGKRRHRGATIQFSRLPLTLGTQGPDLATIPAIAVKQLEVLRDGASAQYGSDAIAGVINFRLRDATEGGTVTARYGQFFEGDGEDLQVQANLGMPFSPDGFFNVSTEYANSDTTSRGTQRPDAQALIDAGNTAVAVPAQRWGNPDAEAIRLFFNSGIELNPDQDFYLFGNFSWNKGTTGFFYRHPQANSVFQSVPLTDQPDGPRFDFTEFFPGGFAPSFGAESVDWSLVGGLEGMIGDTGISYDLSGSHGQNEVEYFIDNTVNPSLGPESPTSFRPGQLQQRDTNVNFDVVYPWDVGSLAAPVNVAAGFEYRREVYQVIGGDPLSFEAGPFAEFVDPDTGETSGLPVGSNGFQGFSPIETGEYSRWNWAAYIDVEADFTDRFSAGLAARFEDFSDFGTTANWKISSRLALTNSVAIRGSANTGFRAPTPGQSNVFSTSTNIDLATGDVIISGGVPPRNPVASFFGATPLEPEESFNVSAGVVFTLWQDLLLTVDYFDIEVDDRISLSGDISIGPAERQQLQDQGIPGANTFSQLRFFTNAFDTTTKGVDAVATFPLQLADGNRIDLSASVNYTDTTVDNITNTTAINRERRLELEDFVPETRANLSANYLSDRFTALLRGNYYGEWTDYGGDPSTDQTFGAEWLVDVEVGYRVSDTWTLTLGGQNVFDNYPDRDARQSNQNIGLIYPRFAPTGFNGGFWYLRARADF